MMKLGKAIALAAAIGACTLGAAPAEADAPGAGYAKFTVSTPAPLQVGQPATVDIVALRGVIVANGKAVSATLDVAPMVGTVEECGSRSCGFVGMSVDLGGAAATIAGTIGDGSAVGGTCQGGLVQLGFGSGGALRTTCDFSVRGQQTGPVTLELTAPVGVPNTAPYIGYFCTSFPVEQAPPCFSPVNVYNPGIGP